MKIDVVTGMGITAKTKISFLPFCVVHDNCHDAAGNEKKKVCLKFILKIIFANYCKGYNTAKTVKEFSIFSSTK